MSKLIKEILNRVSFTAEVRSARKISINGKRSAHFKLSGKQFLAIKWQIYAACKISIYIDKSKVFEGRPNDAVAFLIEKTIGTTEYSELLLDQPALKRIADSEIFNYLINSFSQDLLFSYPRFLDEKEIKKNLKQKALSLRKAVVAPHGEYIQKAYLKMAEQNVKRLNLDPKLCLLFFLAGPDHKFVLKLRELFELIFIDATVPIPRLFSFDDFKRLPKLPEGMLVQSKPWAGIDWDGEGNAIFGYRANALTEKNVASTKSTLYRYLKNRP